MFMEGEGGGAFTSLLHELLKLESSATSTSMVGGWVGLWEGGCRSFIHCSGGHRDHNAPTSRVVVGGVLLLWRWVKWGGAWVCACVRAWTLRCVGVEAVTPTPPPAESRG